MALEPFISFSVLAGLAALAHRALRSRALKQPDLKTALPSTVKPSQPRHGIKAAKVSVNVTNLNDEKGVSTLVVGAASGTYNTFPIAPRQYFVTLSASF
jgi:hypothetical protein